ncbi:MAG TPA: hypothetical protein HA362_01225 [Nanoarchaeota archaeon]|nr:hypothetical protein [Nanoarchaeota archaeon]
MSSDALEDKIQGALLSEANRFIASLTDKYFGSCRINYLHSVALLGIDIKITPEGEVKVIEINGIESGMKGFQMSGVTAEETAMAMMRGRMLPATQEGLLAIDSWLGYKNPVEAAVRTHIRGLGALGTAIVRKTLQSNRIWENLFYNDRVELDKFPLVVAAANARYSGIWKRLVAVEEILADKMQTDRHFNGCRDIKPKTLYCSFAAEERLREERIRYVVVKPARGRCGDAMHIDDLETGRLTGLSGVPDGPRVVEPFVPSKPILSKEDNQMHDGCMRYIMFVEENEKGNINLYHFGGYWHLCPEPISAGMHIDAVRANLAKGAFAEKASEGDLDLVAKVLGEKIPIFYQDMIASVNRSLA